MKTFEAVVHVRAENMAQATQVLNERIYVEEDYGFPYEIDVVEDVHEVED